VDIYIYISYIIINIKAIFKNILNIQNGARFTIAFLMLCAQSTLNAQSLNGVIYICIYKVLQYNYYNFALVFSSLIFDISF